MHLQETTERVVLLDAGGVPIGTDLKATVHTEDTALHLAFSCHVVNDAGQILVTRRALSKKTWPGVWTNSFCGHPQPDEASEDSVARRASHELGLDITDLELVLPDFRYRAVDASGIVENEVCPVYLARAVGEPLPNPSEVMDTAWVDPVTLGESVKRTPWAFSPWLVLQADQLELLGGSLQSARA
ncbi:isopentenyl-diphosphate Delta-isomerase [Mycetocola manganoxydans]|uniref:Isopentenyl-diphosphate Delta-isomerase n=1 Tax=Mycetocola manganoxydans TaxID=699879 RepID=A0A3L6ZTX9_9MICO|nr:isopentenyl-diphosphate Delta-isomerase [Mycetocola manganoxydans]RLP71443.1 isopentenyl-diphosphate Delta-isomerase [Mycetocola manganoxydans]GHD46531.1 isopentenyl-diphosphate Delta-isomerase [Mycetocola manganoxydans]